MTFQPAEQSQQNRRTAGRAKLVVLCAALSALTMSAFAMTASSASAAEAFGALNGNWSGGGSASFASGETEKLRCTAHYSGGGSSLSLALKCASASAQINLTGSLDASGNKVSGDWSENSYGLSGDAHGSTNGGSVRLKISGGANGYLTLSVSGNRHTVALSTQGSTLTGVNVSLGRR
jgi:hypothetical protein